MSNGTRYTNEPNHPRIRGRCPACGAESLFLGAQGYVTCSVIGCKDPGAAHDLLQGEAKPPAPAASPVLERLVLDLQAHAREHGWQDYDEPIAELLAWQPSTPAASSGAAPQERCTWTIDVWDESSMHETSCGQAFTVIDCESLDKHGFQFCVYCGKPVEEVRIDRYADEES